MKSKIIILGILFFLLLPGVILADIPAVEREALIALYNATGGDNWERNDNWKTGGVFSPPGSECGWYGIRCDANHSTVIRIDLSWNNLQGTIPREIGNLNNLESLSLRFSPLTGSIPPEIGNLANLTHLNLSFNELTGTIPPEIGDLTNLRTLTFWGNQLTGTIPPELGNLSNIETLQLCSNQLTGTIPTELSNLSSATKI